MVEVAPPEVYAEAAITPKTLTYRDTRYVTATRVPLRRSPREQREKGAFQARYERWAPLTPVEVLDVLDGFDRPWWIVGGWATEAATGYRREHEDTDMSLMLRDTRRNLLHELDRMHLIAMATTGQLS